VPNLIASLLKQIVQDQHAVSDNVKSLYRYHKHRKTRPTGEEFINALTLEIMAYSKVFIVVDALDECPEDNGTQANLLKALRSLTGSVNLMVTSRDLPSIAQHFRATKHLDIRANNQDLRKYIESRVSLAPRHVQNSQETIVKQIVDNVGGM
jgi:hypothetical protein